MSTYFNFMYLDLDKVDTLTDENDMYNFEHHPSCEELSNPVLFTTTNNYLASDCFEAVLKQPLPNSQELITPLKQVFGNMFWLDHYHPKNEGKSFFFNYWRLQWEQNTSFADRYHLEFYSIHVQHIAQVLEILAKVDLAHYFYLATQKANLSDVEDQRHQKVVTAWIKMFEVAVKKNKGIVFDIG